MDEIKAWFIGFSIATTITLGLVWAEISVMHKEVRSLSAEVANIGKCK